MLSYFKNQKGQAIFEMIIFLPFLIFLYTIFYTVGNSISASINQQKAVRGYFYQLVKGNSYIVPVDTLNFYSGKGIQSVGFFALGWAEKMKGGTEGSPFGNCFKFSSILKNKSTEECDSGIREVAESSTFVRAFTMYGVCGPVYTTTSNEPQMNKTYLLDQTKQMSLCALQ